MATMGSLASRLANGAAIAGCLVATSIACGSTEPAPEHVASGSSPIIGGHDSRADENATVEVYATPGSLDGGLTDLYCSGDIVAPNLVVTARHCILLESTEGEHNLNCNPDGTIADPTDPRGTQTTPLPPSDVTVFVGNDRATLRPVAVQQILTEAQMGICKSDVAFLVLATPALDIHPVLRAGLVRVGEQFSLSGWGYTSDKAAALPTVRQTLDGIPIDGVGPGLMPADTFSAAGGTGCYGDSGAGAVIQGAVVGIFSRLAGPLSTYGTGLYACEPAQSVDYFTMIGAHLDLVRTAFAAAGWTPVFQCGPVGEGCGEGGVCDEATGACASIGEAPMAPPDAAAAGASAGGPPNSAGCALLPAREEHDEPGLCLATTLVFALLAWRRGLRS
jgi:hypothetical protein